MNLLSYYYFLEVAKELNITSTASRLFVTQQCLSGHIRRLEEHYGVELFHRKPRFALTYAGEQMVKTAGRILSEESNLRNIYDGLSQRFSGTLKVGIPSIRALVSLPRILPTFSSIWPGVSIQLTEMSSPEIAQMTLNGDLDFYIGVSEQIDSKLISTPLMTDTVYLIVSDEVLKRYYPDSFTEIKEKGVKGIHAEDIALLPLLLIKHPNRIRRVVDECYHSAGLMPRIYLETSTTELFFELYEADLGAFFCSRMNLVGTGGRLPGANYFPLCQGSQLISYPIVIARHKDRYLTPYAEDFRRITVETFRKQFCEVPELYTSKS